MDKKELKLRRKLNIFFAISMILLYCLYCFVLLPLDISFANNKVLQDTILPNLIEIIYDIVEIVAISIAYAVSAYSIYRYGISKTWPSMILFVCITLFKHLSNVAMDWMNGYFYADRVLNDLLIVAQPLLFESLQYFLVIWISNKIITESKEGMSEARKLAKKLGKSEQSSDYGFYPFKSIFNIHNPMMKTAFWAGIVIIITSLLQSIPFFIEVFSIEGFAAMWILSYILTTVVHGAACYFVMILLFVLFFQAKFKRELYE